jgi:S-formylglutathione hydrolase FrmB
MALFECSFFSDVLGMSTRATVILPQSAQRQIGVADVTARGELPVLYLLHGLSDDESMWSRRSSIERYAAEYPLAIIMPTVYRGFYTDQAVGYDYWTYLSEELPKIMRGFFPLSSRREHTFAAGLSMGGYGAFKLALRAPERFAAAASLSGVLDLPSREIYPEWSATFGTRERARAHGDDIVALAEAIEPGTCPRLYQWCGTEDFLYPENVAFRELAQQRRLPLEYSEGPGDHSWTHWDDQIARVLSWLPLQSDT